MTPLDVETLLTPGEAAKRLGVTPKTVARLADGAELTVIRTPGLGRALGDRRYVAGEVEELARRRAAVAVEQIGDRS